MTDERGYIEEAASRSDGFSIPSTPDCQSHAHSTFGVIGSANIAQLPPNVSIEPITPATVPSFRRIIGLLLPIRYPDKFFAESVANPTSSSLARAAIWHDRTRPARKTRERPADAVDSDSNVQDISPGPSDGPAISREEETPGTVVGGIQCRFEQLSYHPSTSISPNVLGASTGTKYYCYIQTLALLSPYRSKGIATALLETIIATLCLEHCFEGTVSIYAHVWEDNEEALEWYVRKGFHVSGEVLKGYYRRLKPDGARIVWRDLGVNDYLRSQSRSSDASIGDANNQGAG